jgi:hypothetical protein
MLTDIVSNNHLYCCKYYILIPLSNLKLFKYHNQYLVFLFSQFCVAQSSCPFKYMSIYVISEYFPNLYTVLFTDMSLAFYEFKVALELFVNGTHVIFVSTLLLRSFVS